MTNYKPISGPSSNIILTDNLDASGFSIFNIQPPVLSSEAVTKSYVDTAVASTGSGTYC